TDISLPADAPKQLLPEKHADFLLQYCSSQDNYEYVMTEYLRMSGLYWTASALDLLGRLPDLRQRMDAAAFLRDCARPDGGYGPAPGHDSHLLYTLSAVQVALLFDLRDSLDAGAIAGFVRGLQRPDGSFQGDRWGEVDTRFSFCALAALFLLGLGDRLDDLVDARAAGDFVLTCANWDGGFGTRPGSESHSGQVYCCIGALSILGRLHELDVDRTALWLAERQLASGGLNGRPEKLPDVCYSWWVLASLAMLGRLSWISGERLLRFVCAAQDPEAGGIADRPGDLCDPFHTLFGLAGASLLRLGGDSLKAINPTFCLPVDCLDRHGLRLPLWTGD
uniref:Geranylgeranyl transferase type-2 subunit beta n=2 Tax=Macrostomum lignano TaxID=282301 RepID=A0A1I8GU88_9PLAT